MAYPDPGYFDYCASSPPFESAMEKFKEVSMRSFANPSSLHNAGTDAKRFLIELKEQFCNLLNFSDGRLLLSSSGTEANNTIIEGHLQKNRSGRILVAENVHNSIWYATEKYKGTLDILKIEKNGQADPSRMKEMINPATSLVCINHVCNETGAIQAVEQISDICSYRNIKLLVDGAQAIGHIPVDMGRIQCDYYSFSAHKFGAGRSFGGLMIRDDSFGPLMQGGKQEWGLRAGTENIGGLAAALVALNESLSILTSEEERLFKLRSDLVDNLIKHIPGLIVNSPEGSLPGFISLSLPGLLGNEMVKALSVEGFSVSTGSACHDNVLEPSRIIVAIGRSEKEAKGTIRISMGRGTTEKSANDLCSAIIDLVRN